MDHRYRCRTLFDITSGGSRNQRRNWNTMLQVLGLRCQPVITRDPEIISCGQWPGQKVWEFEFTVEPADIFLQDQDPCALLRQDAEHVPMIVGLGETADLQPSCLLTAGADLNIIFDMLHDL